MILGDLEAGVSPEPGRRNLFCRHATGELAGGFFDRTGFVDVAEAQREFERLRQQFEAVTGRSGATGIGSGFRDLLAGGGFDSVVGNPPWLKVE